MAENADSFVEHRELTIAGSGISGFSSAIHATRSNNEPLVFEGDEPDEQFTLTAETDNYPGSPEGASGPELINNMKEQTEHFGTEIRHGIIEDVDASERPFAVTSKGDDVYTVDALTAVSSASTRILGILGEKNLTGYGLSTCTTCDGVFFHDGKIMVIGGDDAAVEEANFLTKFALTAYLIYRREEFHVEGYWINRLMEKADGGEIELMLDTGATELHGSPEEGVDHVALVRSPRDRPSDKLDDPETGEFDFDVGVVFHTIGHTPNADYLDGMGIQRDDDGCIVVEGGSGDGQTATDVPGIFTAGNVVSYYYQQTAAVGGMGVKVVLDADDYPEELERKEKQAAAGVAK